MDIAGDLAALKDYLAKFKKGKMKGLEDIDINELDWVRFLSSSENQSIYSSSGKFNFNSIICFYI